MKIGDAIRALRRERGATLEEIAFAAATDASNLSRIERGRQRFTPEILERIAAALGVTVSQLYLRAEERVAGKGDEESVLEADGSGSESPDPGHALLLQHFDRLSANNQYLLVEFLKVLLRSQKLGL